MILLLMILLLYFNYRLGRYYKGLDFNYFMTEFPIISNQWTGSYMIETSVMKELIHFWPMFPI